MRDPIHRVFLAAALVATALCLSACGGGDGSPRASSNAAGESAPGAAKQAAPKSLIEPGQLTACTDTTFPPMEYFEGSAKEPRGYDIAVMKALTALWNVKPVFKVTTFDGLLPALSAGRCDVAWSSMYITPERTQNFDALPYGKSKTVFLVRHGNPEAIHSQDDLAGRTVAAQTGTNLLETTKKIAADLQREGKTPPKIQQYKDATDLIQQLIVGRADAVPTIDLEAQYRVKKENPGQFDIGFAMPGAETIGIYFKSDDKPVGEAIRRGLLELKRTGTLAKLAAQEYFPVGGIAIGRIQGP